MLASHLSQYYYQKEQEKNSNQGIYFSQHKKQQSWLLMV